MARKINLCQRILLKLVSLYPSNYASLAPGAAAFACVCTIHDRDEAHDRDVVQFIPRYISSGI